MEPHTCYVICAVQRSGSFLLCEALKNTGLAGVPEEYFLCEEQGRWEDEDDWWNRHYRVTSRDEYLRKVFEVGTTPNGVFGVKIMWNYFPYMLRNLRELPEYAGLETPELMKRLFSNPKYIWITRQDKVRQAVSWAKAGQTGVYAWGKGEVLPPQEPKFDFAFINNMHELILEGEAGWANFFEACGIKPFKVIYEEFVEAYEQTALDILDYLSVPYPENLVFGERKLQKQADLLNGKWVEKYIQIKQEQRLPFWLVTLKSVFKKIKNERLS
jgi:LPS sulfotransferase NodH